MSMKACLEHFYPIKKSCERGRNMKNLKMSLHKLLSEIRSSGKNGLTLQRRSFAFFILFLVAVMSGLFLILFSTGAFTVGLKESQVFVKNELGHIAEDVSREFGVLSIEGVALSKHLTKKIEKRLNAANLTPTELKKNPGLLEPILSESVGPLIAALEMNKCSGVFLTLDTTVNPALLDAKHSRAGLFFKNMEPNAINLSSPAIRFLRGPASIARQHNFSILPQWRMEFYVKPGDFFFTTLSTTAGSDLELSRLYYWNPSCTLAGDYEPAMLLCVPLIATDGTILGVCGFEVSAMLFKLKNTPDNTTYTRAFAMFAPMRGNTLDTSRALYAGNYAATPSQMDGSMSIKIQGNTLSSYTAPDGVIYSGLHQKINLYPKNAAFSDKEWALAVLIPEQDLSTYTMGQNHLILILLLVLLLFSVVVAALISRRYIAPVVGAIEMVKTHKLSEYEKTNIQEIDDLFTFLASQDTPDDLSAPTEDPEEASTLFNTFVKNIETLSPAERSVFNLYMEGYTAKEITKILCLSINTIKTHNKRIYTKLNVTSRKELLVYVKMMREKDGTVDDGE